MSNWPVLPNLINTQKRSNLQSLCLQSQNALFMFQIESPVYVESYLHVKTNNKIKTQPAVKYQTLGN